MPAINTGSDLLETLLTPQEVHIAMQFKDTGLSIAYLQNSKVRIFRDLATQEFSKGADDNDNHRVRAYLKGQLDLLEQLIHGALEPVPLPVEANSTSEPQA